MPRTNHTDGTTTTTCSRCSTSIRTTTGFDGYDAISGRRANEIFPFHRATGRYYTMCRSCRRSNSPARATASAVRSRIARGLSRAFGVEFEMYAPSGIGPATIEANLQAAGLRTGRGTTAWTVKGDGSLGPRGVEVTSPALSGDEGLEQIRTATRVFTQLGMTVDRTCGTHVHHDASDLTVDDIKRVARGWSRNQRIIDWFVAPSRRQQTDGFCRPLDSSDLARLDRCSTLEQIRNARFDRYRTLNLAAYAKFGTLEVRQHQGTISYEKVATWIAMGQAVIDSAIVTGDAAPQQSTVAGFIAALGSRLDETAATFLTGRAVQFGSTAVA